MPDVPANTDQFILPLVGVFTNQTEAGGGQLLVVGDNTDHRPRTILYDASIL
jgi:hypothetical protein